MKIVFFRKFTCLLRIALFSVGVILFSASSALAHPYASGVTNHLGTISFILNEAADDVAVVFDGGGVTNDLGALAGGSHSFGLGGHGSYAIVVSKSGSGAPSQISTGGALTDFFGPRGVAINRNAKTGNFGRIYVANPTAGTDSTRTTHTGVYVLNADDSDALGYGTTAYPPIGTGVNQIRYGSSTTDSPDKIFVGPDDSVYVADASGATGLGSTVGGGVWLLGADLTTAKDLFVFNGTTNLPGLVCVVGTPNVTGSLASNNLVLYTTEWNRLPYNNIWLYPIGGGPLPYLGTNAQLASAGIDNVNDVLADLYIAPDGKFFTCEHRSSATGGNVTLRVFASDGVTPLWDSSSAAGGTDPFVNSYGMAVSPDDQYVATGTAAGNIDLCQLTNGIPDLATFTTIPAGIGGICQSIAWDAADNVYGVGGSLAGNDFLRVFSLGLKTVATTSNDATGTNGTFQFTTVGTPPVIGAQPQDELVTALASATFSVGAAGATPLSYHWQFGGVNLTDGGQISGSHSSSLNISNVIAANTGNYQVVITNAYGSVTSRVAVLALTPLPIGWSQFANSPGPNNVRHDDVSFPDATNGWASQNNFIYRTTNGGASWTTVLNLAGTHFRSVAFTTPTVGFGGNLGVGSYDGGVTNTNVLYRTVNGGVTWTNVPGFAEVGMKGLCAIYILDEQHIYGAGRVRGPAYFIKSTDGGVTWSTSSLTDAGVMNGIMDVYFHDPMNGWVVGMDTNSFYTPPYYGRIARTYDGGATWIPVVTTPVANSYFWKMSWPTTNIGYAALQQNNSFNTVIFYKTTDGGNTWVSNGIPLSSIGLTTSQFYLQGLGFVSTNEGWIGGASGLVNGDGSADYPPSFLHTVDGGETWMPAGFNDSFLINRIRFKNPNLGYAAGANVYIYNMPLVITQQPQSQVVMSGSNVNLSVTAASLTPISYQWQKDGANIAATNAQLSINNVTRLASGTYSVILTNAAAGLVSSNAVVRIIAAERLSAPRLLPGGQLQLLFDDADGGALLTTNDIPTFQVLVSTNLTDWTPITNSLSITNGSLLLQDTWTNSPERFYRVVEH